MTPPRVAVLAAFPFPYPQGSQVYVTQQARALAKAGASVTLLTYGAGEGELPADLEVLRGPARLSPPVFRSGPQWRKPLADAALAAHFARAHRHRRFDVALAHNVEAALVAIAARPVTRVPVVYCAHTLMTHELSAYGPVGWRAALDHAGRGLDALVARGADAILALCPEAGSALGRACRGPVAVVPPGMERGPLPAPRVVARVCARHHLEPKGFALYCGNLDAYQELDLLRDAARARGGPDAPIVVATHDLGDDARALAPLVAVEVADFDEMRTLSFAATAAILTRRRTGGFPVKLLNYMEAGRAIVAWEDVAVGLRHGEDAWLLPADAGADALAQALRALERDAPLRNRLGLAAHRRLASHHGWEAIAQQTLDLVERVRAARTPHRREG